MSNIRWLILGGILVLAAGLRLAGLDKYPAGFTQDEAAFGYNAYSLLKTGRDEWGIPFWQLPYKNLKSFGDYKMPLYAFLAVPSVKIFGLNEFSTRLPNAIFGTLAVAVLYCLVYQLSAKSYKLKAGEIAAFLLAISPWAFPLSRGAFEANLITFFLPLALIFFLRGNYSLSIINFSLSLYSYHSSRIIIPLSILGILLIYRPKLNRFFTQSLILLFLLSLPALYSFFFFNTRALDVSIFHPDDGWAGMAYRRLDLINQGWSAELSRLAANKFTYSLSVFIRHYLSNFTPAALFLRGPSDAYYGMLPGSGVLYLIQAPFILLFFFTRRNKSYYLLLMLLLISPIPASLTKAEGLVGNRTAFMVIPLTMMSAAGLIQLFKIFKTQSLNRLITLITLIILSGSFGIYLNNYLNKSPFIHSRAMGYGFPQLTAYLSRVRDDYSQIRINRSLPESHIFLAFYSRTDPVVYQSDASKWPDFEALGFRFLDQYDGYFFNGFRFGDLNYSRHDPGKILYIGRPTDFPGSSEMSVLAAYPDLSPAIVSVSQNP